MTTDQILLSADFLLNNEPEQYKKNTQKENISPSLQPLKKKVLKAFFPRLQRFSHHIFVLINSLPTDKFAIIRYGNYRIEKAGKQTHIKLYSSREFSENYGRFHQNDEFIIAFGEENICFEEELTGEVFEILYQRFLRVLCEQALRNNTPISLTPLWIQRYGLTSKDVSFVQEYLSLYNINAIKKLQSEYDALKNLDCIQK